MKSFILSLILITLSFVIKGQIRTGNGMVYEDDPLPIGYVMGKVYKKDGSVITGLVRASNIEDKVRFKYEEGNDHIEFTPNDLVAFKAKNDSFATISNFNLETFGTYGKKFYETGFAKVLINGPITLFKHYSQQSLNNLRIVKIETYIIGRKEENFIRLITIPTIDRYEFNQVTSEFFKRNIPLSAEIKSGKYNFLDLRLIVKAYNESYFAIEQEKENCEIFLIRAGKGERQDALKIIINDSLVNILKPKELVNINLFSRVNKICVDNLCLYFRSDKSNIQYVECGFRLKEIRPFIQLVNEKYSAPEIEYFLRKQLKK